MGTASRKFLQAICLMLMTSSCGSALEHAIEDGASTRPFAGRNRQAPAPVATPEMGQAGGPIANPSSTPAAPWATPTPAIPQYGQGMPVPTLYVVISGNATCSSGLLGNGLFGNKASGLNNNSLFQGFTKTFMEPGYVTQYDNVIFACYERLSPKMQVYDLRNRPEMVPIDESQLDAVVLPQSRIARRVVIIGHSYGGWRSMKLASSPQLLGMVQGPIQLVTIDPISKLHCTSPLMPGCREAPSDFDQTELATLNTRTRWLNVIQSPGLIVGSGEIPAAHVNLKLPAANHFNILTNPRLWQGVTEFIGQTNNPMAGPIPISE